MKSNLAGINNSRLIPLKVGIAVFGLVAWSGGAARAANILANPNLDSVAIIDIQPDGNPGQVNPCPIGWNIEATKTISGVFYDGGDSEPWCNVTPPSDPSGYGFFFKPFAGTTNFVNGNWVNDYCTVQLFQDNACTPNTVCTLSAYVACEANCSLILPGTPAQALLVVEFLDNTKSVLSSNAFDLVAHGLPTGGPSTMAQLTTPAYTAPAGTVTVRAGIFMNNTWSTSGQQSFFADSLDLEAVPPAGSPVITSQPASITVDPGATAQLKVTATGATSYQWQHAGTNISNAGGYAGTDTATLTITGASAANVGHYRVLVANSAGALYSSDAVLGLLSLAINPVVTITGQPHDTYRIDYATALAPTTWIPLSTNMLSTPTLRFVDPVDGRSGNRFYRATFLY